MPAAVMIIVKIKLISKIQYSEIKKDGPSKRPPCGE